MPFSNQTPLNESSAGLHLHHLDASNLLDIFDHLPFTDLINVASTNINFRRLITTRIMLPIFKIHEKTICLAPINSVYENPDEIRIGKFDDIIRFVENFGGVITKLLFDGSGLSAYEKREISSKIAEYSTELIELDIFQANDFLLTTTNHKFNKAIKVVFRDTENVANFQIHRIYPAMKELHLTATTKSIEYIQNTSDSLANLRALNLFGRSSPVFLQSIKESLPQLESLGFCYYPREFYEFHAKTNQTVHFLHVTSLRLVVIGSNNNDRTIRFPIIFNRLVELEVLAVTADDLPIQLIEENAGLKSLSIPWMSGVDALFRCLRHARNLEELQFEWSTDMSAGTIIALSEYGRLKTVIVDVWTFICDSNAFAAMVPDTWHVTGVRQIFKAGSMKHRVTLERQFARK